MTTRTNTGAATLDAPDNEPSDRVAAIAPNEQETSDGSRNAQRRAGHAIASDPRAVATASVFDALRSDRPYKPARTDVACSGFDLLAGGPALRNGVAAAVVDTIDDRTPSAAGSPTLLHRLADVPIGVHCAHPSATAPPLGLAILSDV